MSIAGMARLVARRHCFAAPKERQDVTDCPIDVVLATDLDA